MRCSASVDARCGRATAIESSRSRCHSGWSITAATWSASASSTGLPVMRGDLAVEEAVGVVPARRRRAVGRRGPSRASSSSASGSRRAARARRARRSRGSSSARASSSARRAGVVRGAAGRARGLHARTASAATNEPAPGRVSITPWTCSAAIASRTDARPTSSAPRQLALGRQPLAGRQQPHADVAGEPLGDLLVAAGWPRSGPRLVCSTDWIMTNWCAARTWYRSGRGEHLPRRRSPHRRAGRQPSKRPRRPTSTRRSPPRTRRSAPARCAIAERRAALLRGAAARLRAAGDEIVAVAEAETGLPEARLRGELERTAGQLEAFAAVVDAGDYVEAIIDTRRPRRQADPAPRRAAHARADRPGRRVRRQQLPARLLDRRRRHRQRAGRRLPGDRQGPPVAPGHERGGRARAGRRGGRRRPARRRPSRCCSPAASRSARRSSTSRRSPPSASPARSRGGKALYDRAAAREHPIPVYAEMGSVNPIVVTEAALTARSDGDRRGPGRLGRVVRRAAVHQAGRRLRPRRRGGRGLRRPTSERAWPRAEPQVLLNERLRDALTARVADLDGLAERGRRRRDAGRAGLPLPPRRLPRAPRPTCASTPTCWRSASAPSCCC